MSSSRSLETIQREHELQAPQTVRINLRLQQELEYPNSNYREKVEDLAVFANSFRAIAPANTSPWIETTGLWKYPSGKGPESDLKAPFNPEAYYSSEIGDEEEEEEFDEIVDEITNQAEE